LDPNATNGPYDGAATGTVAPYEWDEGSEGTRSLCQDGYPEPVRAVFLDRDGVITELVPDPADGRRESPIRADDVGLAPRAVDSLRALQSAGLLLIVVSNQPAAAKGKATLEDLEAVHERVRALLARAGVEPDGWRYCHHHPDGIVPELTGDCPCRKPRPGMLLDAARERSIELSESWMVGDSDADIVAGQAAGCRTVLVEHPASGHRRSRSVRPDHHARDFYAAARLILDEAQGPSTQRHHTTHAASLPER
jgi:D-glycero-D-manno-heptose 1,7-bisphosphate phosphatase